MDILENIKKVSVSVSATDLERLRIEEELLYMLIKNPNVSLKTKTLAFKRLNNINKIQTEIIGTNFKLIG